MSSAAAKINENVIRWSEIRLPHPSKPGELAAWEMDGPFALRRYYRVDGEDTVLNIEHFECRKDDGTLSGCLYCGGKSLERRTDVDWKPIVILALVGLVLAYWTYGLSLLVVAYPIWFLLASSPKTDKCTACTAEFVNFCFGPRP